MTISRRNLLVSIVATTVTLICSALTTNSSPVPQQEKLGNAAIGVKIYTLNTLQKSGHILSTDEAQKIVSSWQGRSIFGQMASAEVYKSEAERGMTGMVDISSVTHTVSNLRIVDNFLVGDIGFLPTEIGEKVQSLFYYGLVSFKPYGYSNIDSNGNMTNYRLIRIDAIQTDQHSSSIMLNSKKFYFVKA